MILDLLTIPDNTNDIDELVNRYKDLDLVQSVTKMRADQIGEAEIKATLAKQGYDAELVKQTMLENANNISKEKGIVTINKQVVATKAATIATKAANIALSMFGGIIAGVAISAVVNSIYSLVTAQERLAQETKESAEQFEVEQESIEGYVSKYEELHEALLNAKGDEEETYKVKKELLALQKELNEKFGDAYGKINLMADAYDDASNSIKRYGKEAAIEWLNDPDNKRGIKQAEEELLTEQTYTITPVINSDSDLGKDIKNIAKQFEDAGIGIEEGGQNQFYVKVTGNVENAKDAINDFVTELEGLRNKYEDSGSANFYEKTIEKSSNRLKKLQELLNDYSTQLERAQLNTVISDYGRNDTLLSDTYEKSLDAEEEYQEAIAKTTKENIYEDERVIDALNEIIKLRDKIYSNKDLMPYRDVFDKVFENVDIAGYEAYQEIQDKLENDNLFKNAAKSIKGMTDVEVKGMLEAFDEGSNSVDENSEKVKTLKNAYEEAGIELNDFITILRLLGIVTGEVDPEIDLEVKEDSLKDAIFKVGELENGFSSLEKIAESMRGKESFDFSLLNDSNFRETFGAFDEEYTNLINKITESPNDFNACKSAFEDLVTTWLYSTDTLKNLSEATADVTAKSLESLGVANASEVVQQALIVSKAQAVYATTDLTEVTEKEINRLFEEANAAGVSTEQFRAYIEQKLLDTPINTSGDIEALLNVVEALGLATEEWRRYYNARAEMSNLENATKKTGKSGLTYYEYEKDGVTHQVYQDAYDSYKKEYDQARKNTEEQIKALLNKPIQLSDKYGASKGGSKKNKDATEFDAAAEAVKRLKEELDDLQNTLNNTDSYSKKIPIIQQMIEKQQEYNNLLAQQAELYKSEYEKSLSSLPQEWQDRVAGNTVDIAQVPESLKDAVSRAQDFKDKWTSVNNTIQDSNNKLKELKNSMRELAQTKLDKEIGLLENNATDIQNDIDLAESMDLEATQEQYEDLISNASDQIEKYKEKLQGYYAELMEMQASGEIDTDRYYELQDSIQSCEDAISNCKQSQKEWNKAILELPIKYLEKANDELNEQLDNLQKQQDDYDSAISGVTNHLQDQIDAQEELKEAAQKAADEQIDALQEQIDALQEQKDALQEANEERQIQLNLEKAKYNLEKAQNQKTTRIYREGQGFVYEADQDAIRNAQDELDQAEFDKTIHDLDKQMDDYQEQIDDINEKLEEQLEKYDKEIERLQEILDSWNNVADAIQEAKDKAMADDILGDGWEDRVDSGDTSDIDNISGKYEENDKRQSWVEKQIEDNEKLIDSVNEYIEAWQQGEISIREAREEINDIVGDVIPEIEANDERVQSVTSYSTGWEAARLAVEANILALNAAAANNGEELSATEARRLAAEQYANQWAMAVTSVTGSLSSITTANANATAAESTYFKQREANISGFKVTYSSMANSIVSSCNQIVEACREAEEAMRDAIRAKKKAEKEGFAKGTRNAKPGLHAVAEGDKPEIIVPNDGMPLIANKETYFPFEGGETVFNPKETKEILSGKNLVKLEPEEMLFNNEQMNAITNLTKNIIPKNLYAKLNNDNERNNGADRFNRLINNKNNNAIKDVSIQIDNISLPNVKDGDSFAKAITDGSFSTAIKQRLYRKK